MKIATIIIVILGVLAAIGLGIVWEADVNEAKQLLNDSGLEQNAELKKVIDSERNGGYALIAGGIVSLISVILLGKLKKISALLILISAVVPAIFDLRSFIATFLLIIGAILAFLYKPKAPASEVTEVTAV